jgi:hypothetical protein
MPEALDALEAAKKRYQEAVNGLRDQRTQIEEDLKFTDPSDPQQWDDLEKRQRENDPGGMRPCLVHDQLGQYIANVAGQVEQRPPAMHALPVNGGADRKVAENLDGFFRQIEYASRAQQHYVRALTSAARAGVGYLIVKPEYTDRALNYQEPRITSEGDPLRVVLDPFSVELDGSDARFGFWLTPMSYAQFEERFGEKAEKCSFDDAEGRTVHDDRESITVAQEWLIEEKTVNVIVCRDGNGDEFSHDEDDYHAARQRDPSITYIRNFRDKRKKVMWRLMSGAAVFETTEYPAEHIGIVPIYGYVGWSEGRMHYCGIGRRGRNAQGAYNYHVSELRAYMNQAPKAPWLVPLSAIQDQKVKDLWDNASVESRAWLPYNDWDAANSRAVAPPQRAQVSTNLQNHIQGALQAREDIQASLGMYQANLGAPSNETSGVAIEGRKQQGEAATANFPAHMAAGVAQGGKLCMQMVPRIIDTKRQLRVLSIDNTPSVINVDPKQQQAMGEPDEQGVITINPNVGRYDVRVVVGASFSTQRAQAQEAYTEMMRANPDMMPAIAPLWAQTLDVPHADKLAQVLTAMAPDPVKAILNPERQDSTAALKAQVDQLKMALKQATDIAHEAQQDADTAHAELSKREIEGETRDDENAIKAYDALTKRLQVMGAAMSPEAVKALVVQTLETMLQHPDPLPGDPPAAEQVPEMAQEMPMVEQAEVPAAPELGAPPVDGAPEEQVASGIDAPIQAPGEAIQ